MKAIFELLKQTYREWSEDKASTLAAALSYYAVFSVGPLLLLAVSIAGLVFGQQAAQGQIVGQIQGTVGPQAAEAIQTMLAVASKPTSGLVATVIGFATLLMGAAGIFGQLQSSLNSIWDVEPKPGRGVMGMVKDRLITFLMVLLIGLLLIALLLISAAVAVIVGTFQDMLPAQLAGPLIPIVNLVVSFLVLTFLFALIYKVLPDVEVGWKDVGWGAAFTALLFAIGEVGLGFYFGIASPGSAYGAAGTLVVLLVWIYYSAQIFFFGAEFTQVYASKYGSKIRPSESAQWVEEAIPGQNVTGGTQAPTVGRRTDRRREEPRPVRGPAFLRAGIVALGAAAGAVAAVTSLFRGKREAGD